jgi:PAS domain S-box-containing protein
MLVISPVLGPDCRITNYVSIKEDITDYKRAEGALRKNEAQVRLILDSVGEAIYGIDVQGNCTFANPACARLLGFRDTAELLGRNMHNLIHHSHADRRRCRSRSARSNGRCSRVAGCMSIPRCSGG